MQISPDGILIPFGLICIGEYVMTIRSGNRDSVSGSG